jgi:membrane-bound lytic murein transglycosylase D
MQLRTLSAGIVTFALFFTSNTFVAAQFAELTAPEDTTEIQLTAKGPTPYRPVTDAVLREHITTLPAGCMSYRVDGVVRGYVKGYVHTRHEKTKRLLGRRLSYFPIFEQKLKEHGLPTDLKYLAVVESALNPNAISRAGAGGLWQFMPSTGAEYGMRINGTVDERSNVVKSTDAAARYLKHLHKQYGDWALALAAYNSGPTRVSSAIRRARSSNFWRIQRYLPEETRNYVPAFIAATYICNFFNQHGLNPVEPDFDEQLTSYIRVHEGMSFTSIANATGIPYSVVKSLNPGFKRDYLPPSTEGNYVVLPTRVMPAYVRHLNNISGSRIYTWEGGETYAVSGNTGDGRYFQTSYYVTKTDLLENFANQIGANGDHLRAWNGMESNFVYEGQNIKVWRPLVVQIHQNVRIEAPNQATITTGQPQKADPNRTDNLPVTPGKAMPAAITAGSDPATSGGKPKKMLTAKDFQWHTVGRNESLEDIARQYNTSTDLLRKLNPGAASIKPGIRLKIRQL